ncbi:TonB-dependent receptor domain-containing protein [Roseateles chitinivorans]|uniref:TonB-dependent receptor domain-containing protein n=1 Tax=Roseateles chitinivorans TaxID=2917965 RepID=UPI003D6653C9
MQASPPRATLRAVARACATALVALPALSVLATSAFAQSSLDPVIIIGTREAQPLSKSVADVVLIDADTLRNSGAGSVADVLRRYAGVQLASNGGPGQQTGYFLRGANTSSTVVMIDGVRVGSATLGQASFESMSLATIERIEVLRGPASGLYGADAVGGVVQIVTKKGQGALNVTGGLAVGEYGSRQGDVGVSGAQAGFDYAASISRETSDGVSAVRGDRGSPSFNPDDDGYHRTVATARLGFTPAEGHRIGVSATQNRLNAQYDAYEFGPPADASGDYRNRLKTREVAVDYRGTLSPIWTTTLQAAHGTDDAVTGLADAGRFKTTRDQYTWQNALRIAPDQQVVLAYERLEEKADGVTDGTLKRTNNAYIAGYSGLFGPAALEANLRRDDNSLYGNSTTGSIGGSYALSSTLKVRALAGKTFRAPTFNDTDFPFYGHHDIRPEKGRSAELGLNWRSGASSASATVYRNKVKDLIVYTPDATLCPPIDDFAYGCAANVGKATLKGATLTGAHRMGNWNVAANVDFLDAKNDETGARLIRRAAHQESVSVDYDTGVWSAGASVTDIGKRLDTAGNLGGYALLDLRATWRFLPQWRLEAKVLNAADRDVEPVYSYQGLGRQAWIGVRYDMKGF